MSESSPTNRAAGIVRASAAVVAVLAVVVAIAFLAFGGTASAANSHLSPASGSSEQWAFGGISSGSYSCTNSNCFNGTTTNFTFSLKFSYYIEWVVIFTQTNVSASQTMIESQAALNASASYTFSGCIPNGTGPCVSESGSISLSGKEAAVGFTNITTGTVYENYPSTVPALAIMNAASQEAFNFSGSYSLSGPFGPGGTTESGSANFDFGANETSAVTFSTPLGIVPVSPSPGDSWNSSAPFSADGSWTSGYSFSASGYGGSGGSSSNWTSGVVSPSGNLFVNGTDLGQYTLYDNYTNPPTQTTAQLIALDFDNGTFEAADGWVLIPFGMYGGVFYGLGGLAVAHGNVGSIVQAQPEQGLLSAPTGESAYYQQGHGFIGAGASGSTSGFGGSTGPSVQLTAGPEPVSVAQSQYNAVTSSSSGGSSSGFPILDVILIVVVVVIVAAVAVVLLTRRRRGRQPAGMAPAAMAPPSAGPSGPTPPTMQPVPAAAAAPALAAAPAAPVCAHCGQPGTYIAQYGRYYCYNDKQYL